MANLLLGPLLRRVTGQQAVIWVQTDQPARVTVQAGSSVVTSDTFEAFGVHLGLVILPGLPPGATPYEVRLDDDPVWPLPGWPASVVTVRDPADPDAVIVFGSCREATAQSHSAAGHDPDALAALAQRLLTEARAAGTTAGTTAGPAAPTSTAAGPAAPTGAAPTGAAEPRLPDLLALIGDQVYADGLSRQTTEWLAGQRRHPQAPPDQVVGFAEYARLYQESWTVPEVRWLLSTVQTVMIFDDHEIMDDWNSSATWLADIAHEPWWHERITAGLASYWLFQHLGNLTPDQLAQDPVWRDIQASPRDATASLTRFAERVATPDGPDPYPWGYTVDLGRTRLIMMDCRGNRVLSGGPRRMWPQRTWDALAEQAAADCDHLVLACSLPWLLAPTIHHGEAAMEVLSGRHGAMERLRRRYDLEHWAAVGHSFAELAALIGAVRGPATVSVLGGDVHHSYVARAAIPGATASVHQITCSPLHQSVRGVMRTLLRVGWWPVLSGPAALAARLIGADRTAVRWRTLRRPFFGNAVATLTHQGRAATAEIEGTTPAGTLAPVLWCRLTGTTAGGSERAARVSARIPAQGSLRTRR